jgi:hypothetical protein
MSGLGPRDELFDEIRLRRALRLDASELPARVDVAAIAARAEASRPGALVASLASTVVTCVAGAALMALAAMALPAIAPAVASEFLADVIDTLARLAVPASTILGVAQQPAVPVAALAGLAVAIAYEYAQRRERLREVTS